MTTGRFPFDKLAKYPHMKPEDVAVWSRFIIKNPDLFATVDYDVCVGAGADFEMCTSNEYDCDCQKLTQKKIDAVAYKGSAVTLIEVKPIANMRALGQMIVYFNLYKKDHPEETNISNMIVCREVERELDEIFAQNGIIIKTA